MAALSVEGWVLGARTSPFSNLEPIGSRRLSATEGNDFAARFRLADFSGPGKTSRGFYPLVIFAGDLAYVSGLFCVRPEIFALSEAHLEGSYSSSSQVL